MRLRGRKNISASIRQRLLNRARSDNRPFNELLQYYAIERFLYRLSESSHANNFILKGALMLQAWHSTDFRPTMDIDLLGRTSNEEAHILKQVRDILSVKVEPDGLVFDPGTVTAERITEDADYEGIRVRFLGSLDFAKVKMQIDIGFGDVIYPSIEKVELPTILDTPAPRLLCYSRESTIAEKFEAMVKFGNINSRMKDFYDIWLLSRLFDFEGKKLAEAVRLTFEKRRTEMPTEIVAFQTSFINAKQTQWLAFQKSLKQNYVPEEFAGVIATIKDFLLPIAIALISEISPPARWSASGRWI